MEGVKAEKSNESGSYNHKRNMALFDSTNGGATL
jgi:hypothetical protein